MEAITYATEAGRSIELEGFDVLLWEVDRSSCTFRRLSGPLVRRLGRELLSGRFITTGALGDLVRAVAKDGLPRACRHMVRAIDGSAVTLFSQVVPLGANRLSGLSLAVGESLSLGPAEAVSEMDGARPELLLRGIADGVTAIRPDGKMIYANEAAALHLGFEGPEQLLAIAPEELLARYEAWDEDGRTVTPEELPQARARRGQTVPPTPIRWRVRGEQEDYWSMVRATPVFDAGGQVQLVISIWHDITQQKRQQALLREQKALLEAQTEASPDGILVVSPEGEILSWNRRFLEIWGLDEDAMENRSDEELIDRVLPKVVEPEEFADRVKSLYEIPEEARDEVRLRDGRVLVRHSSRLREAAGAPLGRIWFFRDVTESTRARDREKLLEVERATREAAERAHRASAFLADASRLLSESLDLPALMAALAHATTAHFKSWTLIDIVTADGMNQRYAAAHSRGWEPIARELEKRIPPSPNQLLAGRFPDLEAEVVQGMPELLEEGIRRIPWLLGEWDVASSHTLSRLQLRSYLAVPIHKGGRVMGALTLGWGRGEADLSREARHLVEDLASRIALAVENARLYESAQRGMVAREEFLSIASHELRTPIATIQLLSQGLLYDSDTRSDRELPPWLQAKVRNIERQCRKLGTLVDRLLDVTRLMGGRLRLQPSPTDLSEVTRETVSSFHEELALQGCAVKVETDQPVVGKWDRKRLEQIVSNLLTNASKYGAGKPLEVRAGKANERTAFLEVTDHGVGIAPEALARIFERFERAGQSRHFAGLGLGLYIVRQVVDAMHGRIEVFSAPGQGSTFRVELPLDPDAATH